MALGRSRRRQRMPPRLPSLLRTERDRTERDSPCDLFQSSVFSGGATCGGMREGGREALAANSDQGQGTRSARRYAILQAQLRSSELLHIGPPYEFDPSVEPVFLRFQHTISCCWEPPLPLIADDPRHALDPPSASCARTIAASTLTNMHIRARRVWTLEPPCRARESTFCPNTMQRPLGNCHVVYTWLGAIAAKEGSMRQLLGKKWREVYEANVPSGYLLLSTALLGSTPVPPPPQALLTRMAPRHRPRRQHQPKMV